MSNEKFQKLSEEFDFIEESAPFCTEPLIFEETNQVVISESEAKKSPYKILGVVKGCFAPIAEYSRNRRLYENDHWNYILQDQHLQERLKNRQVFGEIGHQDKKVDDVSNRAGDISHIVTKMEVREDENGKPFLYGEFEILDTPAGRILEAMYKGGAGLYVSSRAAGKLKPMPGNPNMQIVCKESYYIHGWDVVIAPGFLQAKPVFEQVTESTNEEVSESNIQEDDKDKVQPVQPINPLNPTKQNPNPNNGNDGQTIKRDGNGKKFDDYLKNSNESEEISSLKSQVERLAAVVEKVVDNFYEEPVEENEELEKKASEIRANKSATSNKKELEKFVDKEPVKEEISESMDAFLHLLSETNISDEVAQEILGMIFNKGEEK